MTSENHFSLSITRWKGVVIVMVIVIVGAGLWQWKYSTTREAQFGQHLEPQERARVLELINKYEGLTKKEPNNPDHWMQKGLNQEKLGDIQGAIASYEKSAQLNPKAFLPFEQVGKLYEQTGQYERAERAYLAAIQDDPVKTYLYMPLVMLYMNRLPEKRALVPKLLEAGLAVPENRENPALLEMLLVFYKNTGDVPNAIKAYERLLKVTPNNSTARAELEELKKKR